MADLWGTLPEWNPTPAPQVPQTGATGGDLWDKLPEWTPSAQTQQPQYESSAGAIARQIPVGFNETLADVAGAPVDLMTWGLNKIPGVDIKVPFGGSASIKHGMGYLGINPEDQPAQTGPEQIARSMGGGAAALVVPEAAVQGLVRAGARNVLPKVTDVAERMFGSSRTAGDVGKQAVIGAIAGGAGEAAAQLTPEPYKPIAHLAGSLVGGGVGMLGAEAPSYGWQQATKFVAPMRPGQREALAGAELARSAESPARAKDILENEPRQFVPGSNLTTAQTTGDLGLLAKERQVQQSPEALAEFTARREEQNAARLQAMRGVQETGSPVEVANAVRGTLADIDAMTHGAVEGVSREAQTAGEGIAGRGTPEQYGATLRDQVHEAELAARGRERELWNAIDPDRTITVPMTPVQQAAQSVYGDMTAAAQASMTPSERAAVRVIGEYRPTEPLRELTDLRSVISSDMRTELRTNGSTPAYARLSQLRGAIEQSVSGVVEQRATQEAAAVAQGQLSPEQTMSAAVQRQVDAWRSERAARGPSGESATGTGTVGAPIVRPGSGGQGAAREQPANAAGDQGLQGNVPPPAATFDPAAQARLAEATAATRERAQTYGSGPVGQVLRSGGMQGQFRMAAPEVGAAVFRPGPGGFESVQAFRQAAPNDQTAMSVLQDYVASRLRAVAARPDGSLDPAKTANWLRAHADAMRAFPELAGRFQDAATASRAIEDVAALRKNSVDGFQRSAAGKLLGATNDEDVTRIIGGVFGSKNAARDMSRIAAEARRDPAAMEGLRKSIVDHIYQRFVSNTEVGASGQAGMKKDAFQTFMKTQRGTLRQVFTDREINAMRAIAEDLNRANRSLAAVKIPGQSNTAQDVLPALAKMSKGHGGSLMTQVVIGAGAGWEAGGIKGAAAGAAAALGKAGLGAMREAGMSKVDELVKQAMLDPDLALSLLKKAPAKSEAGGITLAQQLRRISMFAGTQATNTQAPRSAEPLKLRVSPSTNDIGQPPYP